MPKLNPVDVLERVKQRLAELRKGKSIETRVLNKLLTTEQQQTLQQALKKRAGSGKTVRDIQVECFEKFVEELHAGFDAAMNAMKHEHEVRAARVYLDAYFKAVDDGENPHAMANAALQQHGFKRLDGNYQGYKLTERDAKMKATDEELRRMIEAGLTAEEREEIEYWRAQEGGEKKKSKRRSK